MNGLEGYIRNNSALATLLGTSRPSSKTKYKNDFVKIMNLNIKIVDGLLNESKKLTKAGNKKEAERLLSIADDVLMSNKELQSTVVEVLSSID